MIALQSSASASASPAVLSFFTSVLTVVTSYQKMYRTLFNTRYQRHLLCKLPVLMLCPSTHTAHNSNSVHIHCCSRHFKLQHTTHLLTTQIKVMQLILLTNCQQYKVIYLTITHSPRYMSRLDSRKNGLKSKMIFP